MIEISQSGLRLTTPIASEVGGKVSLTLAYREERVDIRGVVRWHESASLPDDDDSTLASWEVGIAFTAIGEVSSEGIWRGLRIFREAEE